MATTYDATKDPYTSFVGTPGGLGVNSTAGVKSDTADFTKYPKGIVVTATGDLVVLPLKAADDGSHLITFSAAPCGFIVPFRVRRVQSTSTTASFATIED